MDAEIIKETGIKEKGKRGGIHQPFSSTWEADFMLRQDAIKFMLGKYLSEKKIHGGEGDVWGWLWQELRQQPEKSRDTAQHQFSVILRKPLLGQAPGCVGNQ